METAIKTERVGNYRITVGYSYDVPNPRTAWDNASHMVIKSRYIAAENDDVEGVLTELCERYGIEMGDKKLSELIDELNQFIVIKPISVYTHSGSTVYYGEPCDRWDSGLCGFGYMEHEDLYGVMCGRAKLHYPNWRDQCEAIMKDEMEVFDKAVRGDVYEYYIERLREPSEAMKATPEYDSDWWEADDRNWEFYDSFGGFFLTPEEVIQEAKAFIQSKQETIEPGPVAVAV